MIYGHCRPDSDRDGSFGSSQKNRNRSFENNFYLLFVLIQKVTKRSRQKQCSAVFVGPTHNEESVDLKFHFFIAMLG